MAKSFNLTAKINAQLGNVKPVVQSLKRQLSGIKANVNVNITANAAKNVAQLNRNLTILNATLKQTAIDSRAASTGLTALGQAAGGSNFASLAKQAASINKALNNTKKASTDATNQMEEFGRVSGLAIRRFAGFTVATGIVFGFVNALSSAVSESILFDTELIKIGQAVNSSKAGVQGLAKEISRLGADLGVSSKSLVDVSLTLAQAGLSARDTKIALEALAKSSLAPTFTDIKNTVEGSIAAMAQFEIGAKDLEEVLGSVNAVSAKFAVESDDIIAAIRRTGGVFAAASKGVSQGKDALNEFVAVFTSIRATTRESAETIATGLRTIFTRFQRSDTISNLQELGIELTDAEGKFIGAYKAVDNLAKGLKGLDPRDLRFSQIVEELGGFRQVSKVIPLIAQTEKRILALKVAQEGKNSLDKDAARAQEALANKISKVREEFLALIREVSETQTFKTLVDLTLQLTKGLIDLARTVKPLIPIFALIGGIKLAGAATQFGKGFIRGTRGKNDGGYAPKFHSGGLVPGGKGTKDDYPATLQQGEYVIRQKAVDAIGVNNLDKMNRNGYAAGGIVKQSTVGAAILRSKSDTKTETIDISENDSPYITGPRKYKYVRQGVSSPAREKISKRIRRDVLRSIQSGSESLVGQPIPVEENSKTLLKTIGLGGIEGNVFEGILKNVAASGKFDKQPENPNRPFDFVNGFGGQLTSVFDKLNMSYIEAKNADKNAQKNELKRKILGQAREDAIARGEGKTQAIRKSNQSRLAQREAARETGDLPKTKEQLLAEARKAKAEAKKAKRLGLNSGGEVPAILTRGEYVIQKSAADKLGKNTLDKLNHADKYHTGGLVGFSNGGDKGRRILGRAGITGSSEATAIAIGDVAAQAKLSGTIGKMGVVLNQALTSFQALNLDSKTLDRTIRVYTKAILSGKSQQDSLNAAQSYATKATSKASLGGQLIAGLSGKNTKFGKLGKLNGQGALIGSIAASTLSNQLDPKGESVIGQALVGATSGAAFGSVAGPYGAAVGGVVGAASSALNAKAQNDLNKSTQNLAKSTQDLEKAFENLSKSADKQSEINKILSSGKDISTELKNQSKAISRPIFGAGRAAKNKFGGEIADSVASASADSIAVVNKFVEQQVQSGGTRLNTKTAQNQGIRTLAALGSDQATAEQKAQIGLQLRRSSSGNDEKTRADANVKLDLVVESVIQATLKAKKEELIAANQIKEAEKAATLATLKRLKELDRVFDRLEKIGATFNRTDESIDRSRGELDRFANGGGDIRRNSRANVFANTNAFTTAEISKAAKELNSGLGNTRASRELTNNAVAANLAKDIIPQVIAEATAKSKLGDENVGSFVISELNTRLKAIGLDETVIRSIAGEGGSISSALKSRKDSETILDESFFAGAGLENIAAESLDKFVKTAAQGFETLNKSMAMFEDGINKAIQLQLTENRVLASAIDVRARGQLELRNLRGDDISLEDTIKPFEDSIKRLTNGQSKPGSILKNVNSLEAQRQTALNNASSSQDSGAVTRFLTQAGSLQVAIEENREALQTLSQDTSVLSEVQKRLADLESKRQQAEKTIQELAFGNKDDRREFNRRAGLGAQLLAGRQLEGPDLQAALQAIEELGQVLNASGIIDNTRKKNIDQFGQNAVLNNKFVNQLFGGVDPGLKKIRGLVTEKGGEKDNLIKVAEDAIIRQADAADAIAKLQVNTNVYLQQLNAALQANTQVLREGLNRNAPPIKKNSGGLIPGGGPNRDTVHAMLTKGEYVVNRDATNANLGLLESINNGYNIGGKVESREDRIKRVTSQNNARKKFYQDQIDARKKARNNTTTKPKFNAEDANIREIVKSIAANNGKPNMFDEYNISQLNPQQKKLGSMYLKQAMAAKEAARIRSTTKYNTRTKQEPVSLARQKLIGPSERVDRIAIKAALGFGTTEREREYIKTLSPEERRQGSSAFQRYRKQRGFNNGGSVGGSRTAKSGAGNNASSIVNAQFGQYAQVFASSAAQFEKAANILAKINIPSKIEMTGTHTVQVIINGADVLANIDGSMRQLVTAEITKAMRKHINPITGETSGDN